MATEYNVADFESSDEEGEKSSDIPPEENLFSAALFLQDIFASHDIPYALTGGFSLRLRGSDRQARQIDFAVQPSGGMRQLKDTLRPYARVRYPNMCEGIMKIFVETGSPIDQCAAKRRIEVDLKQPGIAGSPLDLSNCRVNFNVDTGNGRMEKFMLLDLFHALNGKLKVLYERRYLRDFHDVDWLLAEHTEEVRGFIEQLDEDGIRAFIDSLSAEKRAFWVDFFVMSDSENELNTNSRHAGDSSK